MFSNYFLGEQLEGSVRKQLAYEAEIERGIAAADAGQVHDADELFDALEERYARLAEDRGRK